MDLFDANLLAKDSRLIVDPDCFIRLKSGYLRLQSGVLELCLKNRLRAVLSAEGLAAVEDARHGQVVGKARHGKKKAALELKARRDHTCKEVKAGPCVNVKG